MCPNWRSRQCIANAISINKKESIRTKRFLWSSSWVNKVMQVSKSRGERIVKPGPPVPHIAARPAPPKWWQSLFVHAARPHRLLSRALRRGVDAIEVRAEALQWPTAGQIMDRHGGTGPGFDALRFYLSVAIVIYHAKQVVVGREVANYQASILFPYLLALVPIFFCLSGFLVTGSAVRTPSIRKFLTNRSLRIFPALAVEVTLSALILGPLLTSSDLQDYFQDKRFFSYFGNIVGRVRMSLPGVFDQHPIPDTVNASLWTLQPEFYCYLIMTALMLSTIAYRRRVATLLYGALTVALSTLNWRTDFGHPGDVFPEHVIVYYFVTGIIAFHWVKSIPIHGGLFIVAAILSYYMITVPGLMFLAAVPIAYCTIYIGLSKFRLIYPFNTGDYSYGIYLFNFPIQQTVVHFFPGVKEWWLLLLISLPLTILFAAASWRWVEKPALRLKRHLTKTLPQVPKA
jgi:peptidoglycan/LPS O-acetylase OafA/YrhL